MINFTVGPVQSDKETLAIGKEQVPYFRTSEFSALMKENESILKNLFDCTEDSRAVFMTGSGTASMEAGIMNFFGKDDKVLVVNGGSFGHRLVELCALHELSYEEITLNYGEELTKEKLYSYEGKGFTGMALQLCETSTGVLYDMNMVGEFCKKNNIFLFVDAVSGFLADKFSMKNMNVNAAITGSQKALALPPGLSIIMMDQKAVERVQNANVKCMYFNLKDCLKNMERGQTPFTPAVSVLIQLNEKLKRIMKNGGVAEQNKIIAERAEYFRKQIAGLPFKMFVPQSYASNCVTALDATQCKLNAKEIFEKVKNEYKIWICPNAGDMAEKVFRVGHIGTISKKQIDKLVKALKKILA